MYLSWTIAWHGSKQLIMKGTIPKVGVNPTLSVLCVIFIISTEYLRWHVKHYYTICIGCKILLLQGTLFSRALNFVKYNFCRNKFHIMTVRCTPCSVNSVKKYNGINFWRSQNWWNSNPSKKECIMVSNTDTQTYTHAAHAHSLTQITHTYTKRSNYNYQ